jgi:hypothetical protein
VLHAAGMGFYKVGCEEEAANYWFDFSEKIRF